MVWEQLSVTTPHIAYATTGFALILFGTISLFIKEKLYIGEANVATIYGLIVGPHCLKWFKPSEWGNSDYITLELSRIVLVVQIFAVAVELPKKYMLRHWFSVLLLLVPVMTFGWMLSSVFIWKLVPTLRWIEALAIAACVTATDPVLASAVVGKGKFAKRVPGHLRNILSAESGCNDGMAFPFVYLALNVMKYEHHAKEIAVHFICISVLYECVLGCLIGVAIGYCGRHLIKFAERKNLIDRESFLVYYFCLALFCAGVGTLTGTDDLLVAFAAGAAFAWDGWFAHKTEETHVSNVIDLLVNTAYFIYFGAIIPWPEFNNHEIGLKAWKLVIIAILILLFRRLPIVCALKPIIPDIKTWREAFFSGHFGPIGVGGLFVAILARAEMEENPLGGTIPLRELPPTDHPHYYAIATIWPITCFLVLSSIIVHGSSIAIFTMGKRLNNIAITMTYTTNGQGPSWIRRMKDSDGRSLKLERIGTQYSEAFKARRKNRKHKKKKPGHRRDRDKIPTNVEVDLKNGDRITKSDFIDKDKLNGLTPSDLNAYQEGHHIMVEDNEGNVVQQVNVGDEADAGISRIKVQEGAPAESSETESIISDSESSPAGADSPHRRAHPEAVHAYKTGNQVLVENEDGEVVRRYKILKPENVPGPGLTRRARDWLFNRKEEQRVDFPEKLIPIDDHGHEILDNEKADDHGMKEKVEHSLNLHKLPDCTNAATMEATGHRSTRHFDEDGEEEQDGDSESGSEIGSDDEVEDDDGEMVSDDEIPFQGDDGEEGETEVERARRLAALGLSGDAVDSDEDDYLPEPTHRRINTIPEEDTQDEEQKISFSLPKKH